MPSARERFRNPVTPEQALRDHRSKLSADLRAVRRQMRKLDLAPPELPAELASIDE